MTNTPDEEPTLADVIAKLDKLSTDVEKFNDRFSNYHWILRVGILPTLQEIWIAKIVL